MKKFVLSSAVAVAAFASSLPAHAVTINAIYSASGALPGYTTAQVIQDFTTSSPNATAFTGGTATMGTESVSGVVRTFQTSVNNVAIGPVPASGTFLSIGGANPNGSGSYTLNFGSTGVQFLSFLFGGLDNWNQVTLNFASGTVVNLQGSRILTGLQSGPTSTSGQTGRVSYDFLGTDALTSAVFSSSQAAFEIDEIAAAAPEPATWGLMLLGFGLVGAQIRRRRGQQALQAA